MAEDAPVEDEGRTWFDVAALRIELLYASIGYGIYAALSEGGSGSADEWNQWLDWVSDFCVSLRQRDQDREVDAFDRPGWLMQMTEVISDFAESGAEARGDLFQEERVRAWVRAELERMAVCARPIEQVAGEPLGEVMDRASGAGMALLGAVQDSMVLALSDRGERRARRASASEIYERLVAARQEGVWDVLVDS